MADKQNDLGFRGSRTLRTLAQIILAGVVCIIVYSLQSSSFLGVVSVGVMVAGASLLLGGVLGFLFGIPRTLQNSTSEQIDPQTGVNRNSGIDYMVNTNLEQISDWLTKILVGVGLTQLTSLPEHLNNISKMISDGMGGTPGSSVFAISFLLYFFVAGFLLGYLWTRLYLSSAFRQADRMVIESLSESVKEIQKQSDSDDEALRLVSAQLSKSQDEAEISQEDMNKAILSATPKIRARIFNKANAVRRENWQNNKPLMERTISIFKALIESDTQGVYHKNHGQLGFTLKDQREEELQAAIEELSIAIKIRGPWQEHGWRFYEFNRALCKIKLEAQGETEQISKTSTLDAIIADLKAAITHDTLKKTIVTDETIQQWMQNNDLSVESIM